MYKRQVVHSSYLPDTPGGALREHRLYQADWLLRFYGFDVEEIVPEGENLAPEYDPKCAWALRNLHLFPIEVNRAPLEMLLRVPGIGAKSAYKITEARRHTRLTFEHLKKMRVVLKRARHFITASGKFYGVENEAAVRGLLAANETAQNATQLSLFTDLQILQNQAQFALLSNAETARSALTGEL